MYNAEFLEFLRRFRVIYTPFLHLCFVLLWPVSLIHRFLRYGKRSKRVLLVAQNEVAADHMRYINHLLSDYVDISQCVTTDWVPPRGVDKEDICKLIDAPFINVLLALLQHWDLIIFTNHPFGVGIWFSPMIKKLYVNHGIHIGKINNDRGEDGVYGRSRVNRPFGRPYYSRMFAGSEYEKRQAAIATRELEGLIRVTGYLRADRFVAGERALRLEARKTFGYLETSKVVHIISTWGAQSLYDTCGEEILDQLRNLRNRYDFIFSLHPRYDEFNQRGGITRREILRKWELLGVRVNRDLNWDACVAASDIAISDHSSLCLYHVLVNHPVALVDIPRCEYVPDSLFAMMKARLPVFSNGQDLEAMLLRLSEIDLSNDFAFIKNRMLDFQGAAEIRYQWEIEDMLGLQVC